MTSSSDSNEYPNSLEFIVSLKSVDEFCVMVNASFSITIPFIKNIKSFSVVAVIPVGADAVVATNFALRLLTKLPV